MPTQSSAAPTASDVTLATGRPDGPSYTPKRCSAPCVGLIEPDAYKRDVELAVMFLEGRSNAVLEAFKVDMHRAAEALDY